MAQATFVQEGRVADYTPSSDVDPGDVIVQSSLIGVSSQAIDADALGSIAVDGIFDVVKITGVVSAGAPVYWDPTGDPVGGTAGSGAATTTQGALKLFGWAVLSALSAGTTVRVKLANVNGVAIVGALTQPIADPGDAGAIPVTGEGQIPIVTAGAETRTLADPTIPGQQLLLYFIDDGGDCVITAASAINQTGNNTITFSAEGAVIQLVGIEDAAASFEWRVVHNDGGALTTV